MVILRKSVKCRINLSITYFNILVPLSLRSVAWHSRQIVQLISEQPPSIKSTEMKFLPRKTAKFILRGTKIVVEWWQSSG